MKQDSVKSSWCKDRHRVIRSLLGPVVRALCHLFYRDLFIEPIRGAFDGPCLILYNHQTAFDQFFISLMKQDPVYHVATEDLFSNGWPSRLLEWLVAPIPIRKQVSDLRAVKLCVQVAREGGTIAIAPEGNRTFDGRTVYINPAVAKLAKLIRLPLVLVRIEGGYGAHPRWSDVRRNGPVLVKTAAVISPEELKAAGSDALYQRICEVLYEDESGPRVLENETQAVTKVPVTDGSSDAVCRQEKGSGSEGSGRPAAFRRIYSSNKSAEYMERLFYVCPSCGFSHFKSRGTKISCTQCGMKAEYTEDLRLVDAGGGFPFHSIREWYDFQQDFVRGYDPKEYRLKPVYTDTAKVLRVHLYERKEVLFPKAQVQLFGDRIEIGGDDDRKVLLFSETGTVTVAGRNKVNVYCGEELFQLKGAKRFNAVRFMNLFYRYIGTEKGKDNDEFLGL